MVSFIPGPNQTIIPVRPYLGVGAPRIAALVVTVNAVIILLLIVVVAFEFAFAFAFAVAFAVAFDVCLF